MKINESEISTMQRYFKLRQFPNLRFIIGPNFMTQAVYMIVVPLFYMAYCFVYNPFGMREYYDEAILGYGFNFVMLAAISLLVLAASRPLLHVFIRRNEFSRWHYLAWCMAEIFIISAFTALYTILMRGQGEEYIATLATCMQHCFLILAQPYILILLIRTIMGKNEQIALLEAPKSGNLLKFHDEHKRLKFTIASSSLLYIKSDFNYVLIYYLENGKTKEYQLRCSMKSIEKISDGKTLVRCHRSYFVNPEHITILRKDKEGFIFAELDISDATPIPVSKSYYSYVSDLL